MEFLVFWAAAGVGCYFVAKSKGRNAAGWAVAGFLFSLIALLIVALLPTKKQFQHPYASQPGPYGAQQFYGQQPGYGVPQQVQSQQLVQSQQQVQAQQPSPPPGLEQRSVVGSVSIELARLGAMHRSGQMSDVDFEAAKRRLLNK